MEPLKKVFSRFQILMLSVFAGKEMFKKWFQKQLKIMQEKASLGQRHVLGMDILSLILLPVTIINWNQIFAKFRRNPILLPG